jgi:hypothetical protein
MSWFEPKKPVDPLAARERQLEAELARLQGELARLERAEVVPVTAPPEKPVAPVGGSRPFAEPVQPESLPPSAPLPPGQLNEFGVRKYDLRHAWHRLTDHLRGPTSNNPRMAKMLAAGSIHGLRPLRYERRVARNRFIALFVILLLILWGLGYTYIRDR